MVKFLHAADFHLDTPFRGLSPEQAIQRRREQRELLETLTDLANRQSCDLMLLAGDLLDSDNAFPETVQALVRALGAFRGQVFIAPGNHDCLLSGSPYLSAPWPDNVHIFTQNKISSVTLPQLGCQVYGAGFTAMDSPALLEGFRVQDEDLLNLMVLHGDTETAGSPYNPISKEQISASGLDYLALGHIHKRKAPEKLGKTTFAWPGCMLGRGFDECGEKGVYIGTLTDKECNLEFHPLPGRRYEILTVACKEDPLQDILRLLPADCSRDIYRIYLTGECDEPDLRSIYLSLEDKFYALHLKDKTTRKVNIWADAGEDSLRGQFLATLQEKLSAAATEEEQQIILLAAELGLRAMEGREELVL